MALLPLLGLAGLVGLLAAWLTVLLLLFRGVRVGRRPALLCGPVHAASDRLAAFAADEVAAQLPPPSRFFEHLGPDRFRREIFRNLRGQADSHVDDVMARRNARAWGALSDYARGRVYGHFQRRLPFVVDNFVEQVHRDLDGIVQVRHLIAGYFAGAPEAGGQLFLAAFGADLRASLPVAVVVGVMSAWLVTWILEGTWLPVIALGVAALSGSLLLLAWLCFPRHPLRIWPFRVQGVLFRRRARFLRLLARRLAGEALSWRSLSSEFLRGGQAVRVRQIMRREVGGILDGAVFKATLQLLVGPQAVVEVKQSALEKAMDVLTTTPISPALQESYRLEVERSLLHAADQDMEEAYARFWEEVLAGVWKVLPPLLAVGGGAIGGVAGWLL